MSRLPRVVSPVTTLFTRDGIDVALVSVELWPEHLVVRLAVVPPESAVDFEAAERLLGGLQVEVEDDAGTAYRPRSAAIGGTGSEWHGDWFFAAEAPESVRRLTLRVAPPAGEAATVVLRL